VIGLYYYGEATMKQIGAEIGVNESRVSQLHARAIRRLRETLGDMGAQQVAELRTALVAFAAKPVMAKVKLAASAGERQAGKPEAQRQAGVVLPYKVAEKPALPVRATPVKIKVRTRQALAAAR
jgi:hypothetical protein